MPIFLLPCDQVLSSQVFVVPRICRQAETKHNKPQRQYFVCFSRAPSAGGTFTEYPIFHFSPQCFQSPLRKTKNILDLKFTDIVYTTTSHIYCLYKNLWVTPSPDRFSQPQHFLNQLFELKISTI